MRLFIVLFFIASFVAVALAESEMEENREARQVRCPSFCSGQHNPVCTSNNRCIRSFINRCELVRTNCNLPASRRWNEISRHYCNNFASPHFSNCPSG